MNIFRKITLLILKGYQYLISPILGNNCRYIPSCSSYTHTAIEHFGVLKGGWMGLKRILRCHPFHPGGLDLIPKLDSTKTNDKEKDHKSG